jgi:hypothetical protein
MGRDAVFSASLPPAGLFAPFFFWFGRRFNAGCMVARSGIRCKRRCLPGYVPATALPGDLCSLPLRTCTSPRALPCYWRYVLGLQFLTTRPTPLQ